MAGLKPAIFISILTTITIYNFELFRMEMNLHFQEVGELKELICERIFGLENLFPLAKIPN